MIRKGGGDGEGVTDLVLRGCVGGRLQRRRETAEEVVVLGGKTQSREASATEAGGNKQRAAQALGKLGHLQGLLTRHPCGEGFGLAGR